MPAKKNIGVRRLPNSHFYEVDFLATNRLGARVHLRKRPFATAGEASEWLAEELRELNEDPSLRASFKDIAEGFLTLYESQNKRSSFWGNALFVRHNLESFFDSSAEVAYSAEKLQAFRTALAETAHTNGYNNHAISLLRRITQFGFERDLLNDKQWKMAQVYLKPFRDDGSRKEKISIWSFDDYKKFVSTFDFSDKYKVLFELMFATGIRIGECLALKIGDYDPKQRTIDINKTAESKCGTGKIEIQTPKTKASVRVVLLDQYVCSELDKIVSLYANGSESFLFFGGRKPLAVRGVRDAFNKHSKQAGLSHIRLHDIRHSYNSWLLDQHHTPEDVVAVTKRLGRASVKVTLDTYYHAQHDKESELVDGINYDPKK